MYRICFIYILLNKKMFKILNIQWKILNYYRNSADIVTIYLLLLFGVFISCQISQTEVKTGRTSTDSVIRKICFHWNILIAPVDCICVVFKWAYMDCCCFRSVAAAPRLHRRTSCCCSSGWISSLSGRLLITSCCCCWRRKRTTKISAGGLLLVDPEELQEEKELKRKSEYLNSPKLSLDHQKGKIHFSYFHLVFTASEKSPDWF